MKIMKLWNLIQESTFGYNNKMPWWNPIALKAKPEVGSYVHRVQTSRLLEHRMSASSMSAYYGAERSIFSSLFCG